MDRFNVLQNYIICGESFDSGYMLMKITKLAIILAFMIVLGAIERRNARNMIVHIKLTKF